MAKSNKQTYIAVSSLSSASFQSLLLSTNTKPRKCINPKLCFFALFLFGFLGTLNMWLRLGPISPFLSYPCGVTQKDTPFSTGFVSKTEIESGFLKINGETEERQSMELVGKQSKTVHQDSNIPTGFAQKTEIDSGYSKNSTGFVSKVEIDSGFLKLDEERKEKQSLFWEQPDGLGYRPCLNFSKHFNKYSKNIIKDRKKYLIVVVSGGLNQQRNQIVDAVVIARILGAALVVPILQVNAIWGDESEFADIFDLEHFKNVLSDDVRIISSLPSTHIMWRPIGEQMMPPSVTPHWIRAHYLKKFKRDGVVLLRGIDSRLTKDLSSDLQKLRCKVAFHALKFAPTILELGNKFTERMRSKGPYLALHLRMEIDVWVRTGCLPGLSSEYDKIISNERKLRPELLTSKSNMTSHERKLAGLCPLNALEVTRLLKALGAPENTRIYRAGGEPLGGKDALIPLINEFPNLYNKDDLAMPGELEPYMEKASFMAAIDYIVAENSDVFMPSHGGNMGHALQGNRAYAGHKKFITPNKRKMLPYFLNSSIPESVFNDIIIELHKDSLGQPKLRTNKIGSDVTKFPIPECMCKGSDTHSSL